MSQAASQANKFYQEVALHRCLWTIRDKEGFPAPLTFSGKRSQPFWSSRQRAELIIATISAYSAFEPVAIDWQTFLDRWAPGLTRDKLLVGVNWSGRKATGYDVEPADVTKNVNYFLVNES